MLNGWQRIWIVLSVLAAIISSAIGYDSYEKYEKPKKLKVTQNNIVVAHKPRDLIHELELREALESLKEPLYLPTNMKNEDIGKFIDKYAPDNTDMLYTEANKLLKDWETSTESKRIENNKSVTFKSLLYWFVFTAVLYIIGWSIGWIYRGFKNT